MPQAQRRLVRPLIEIPPVPWNHTASLPSKTIDQHLARFDNTISELGYGKPFLFRFPVDQRNGEDGGQEPSDGFHTRSCPREKSKAIPVTNLVLGAESRSFCKRAISVDHRGVCIRLQPEDFDSVNHLDSQVAELLEHLGASCSQTDLLSGFGLPCKAGGYPRTERNRISRFAKYQELVLGELFRLQERDPRRSNGPPASRGLENHALGMDPLAPTNK